MSSTEQDAAYQKAVSLFRDGNISEAKVVLERLFWSDTSFWESAFLLGVCHFRLGNFGLASDYMEHCVTRKKDPRAMYYLALSMQRLGRRDEAQAIIQDVLRIDPEFSEAKEMMKEMNHQGRHGELDIPSSEQRLKEYEAWLAKKRRAEYRVNMWHGVPWPVKILHAFAFTVVFVILTAAVVFAIMFVMMNFVL